jgi:hypothetical protein
MSLNTLSTEAEVVRLRRAGVARLRVVVRRLVRALV